MTDCIVRRLLVGAVVIAALVFVVRGPIRFVREGAGRNTDLTAPYLGARAWTFGLNPYDGDVFWAMAAQAGWRGVGQHAPDDFESHSAYPLTTFVMVAPLAPLEWQPARRVAIAAMAILFVAGVVMMSRLPVFDEAGRGRLAFLATALLMTPAHTGLRAGNLVSAAIGLGLIGTALLVRNRALPAGMCLGFAACVKPQIAAPILVYALWRSHWRALAAAIAIVVLVLSIGAVQLRGTEWLSSYMANNALLLSDRGVAIVEGSEAQRQFITLPYLGYQLFGNSALVTVLTLTVGGGLCLAWLVATRRPYGGHADALIAMSAIAVISLLPVYHRVYDASLLLLPLCWAVSTRAEGTKLHRRLVLLLLVPFLIPATTWIETQTLAGRFPAVVLSSWWWRAIILPHQVWALIAMSVVLLCAQLTSRQACRSREVTARCALA